jgi:LPPG:FO 2-phospho-L-lactate transferase
LKVVALAGGTGSAKLLQGLVKLPIDLTVVANVGDNFWTYGVYVCPDVDIACYTLAGIADRERGWGLRGDTFEVLGELSKLGEETWFRLGDKDLATCLARTRMLRRGKTLTYATGVLSRKLGVEANLLPVTDDEVETRLATSAGDLHLQEFWVREKGMPKVERVWHRGAKRARVTRRVSSALLNADRVVICPANPVTSIGPMLAVPGFSRLLCESKRVVALSPMSGRAPYSGPAGKLMKAAGFRHDSVGVAELYSQFLDCIVISEEDSALTLEIGALGVKCMTSNTSIHDENDSLRLARELLRA